MPKPTQEQFNARFGATGSIVREHDPDECEAIYRAADILRCALGRRDLSGQVAMATMTLGEFANLSACDGDLRFTKGGKQR